LGSSDEDFEEQLKKVKGVKCEGVRVLRGYGRGEKIKFIAKCGLF